MDGREGRSAGRGARGMRTYGPGEKQGRVHRSKAKEGLVRPERGVKARRACGP